MLDGPWSYGSTIQIQTIQYKFTHKVLIAIDVKIHVTGESKLNDIAIFTLHLQMPYTVCSNLQRVAFPVRLVPTVPFFPWRFKPPRVVRWGPESSAKDTCWSPFETFSARRNSNALQHEGDDNHILVNNSTTSQSSCKKV